MQWGAVGRVARVVGGGRVGGVAPVEEAAGMADSGAPGWGRVACGACGARAAGWWALVAVAALGVGRADVLDRVAASAGQQVVTLSAVRRQLRIEALVENRAPEYTAESLRAAAERLVEQALLRREIELSRYTLPPMAAADAALEKFVAERRQTAAEFQAEVRRLGFSEDDFRKEVRWRISVERFVASRFAPGVQVSDAEIESYYAGEYTRGSRARDANAKLAPLEEVREAIAQILTARKTDAALDAWLAQTRETLQVQFFEEALKP